MDEGGTDKWMTYRELADTLGISLRAAEARARRNIRAGRWRHRIDNDAARAARVLVPHADLRRDTVGPTHPLTVEATAGATNPHTINVLLAELKDSREAEAMQRERAAKAEGEALALREALAREARRAEQTEALVRQGGTRLIALETERRRLQAQIEATAKAEQAQVAAADAARQTAEREREAARAELASWTAGGPLARALRAFLSRRGQS
jgi:hypothetical protein